MTKSVTKLFQLHQIWRLFLHLAAEKKKTFLVQLKQIFGPSYSDRALAGRSFGNRQTFLTSYIKKLTTKNKLKSSAFPSGIPLFEKFCYRLKNSDR
jgi:hypothetical protein